MRTFDYESMYGHEKVVRAKYQTIVYEVCNLVDSYTNRHMSKGNGCTVDDVTSVLRELLAKRCEPEPGRRLRVYVAGPYTKPDPCINTNSAILVGTALWKSGYAPFIPHLSHFWHTVTPMPYEDWLEYDNQFLPVCDALLRLHGESSGADKEVALAESLGIPVFYIVKELNDWRESKGPNRTDEAAA